MQRKHHKIQRDRLLLVLFCINIHSNIPSCRRNDENVLDHTFYKLKNFDRYSFNPDKEYRRKVYNLLDQEIDNVVFGEDIKEIYERRYEKEWRGADTVYDLYLLGTARERDWFPYEVFEAEYPDFREKINESIPASRRNGPSSPSQCHSEKQSQASTETTTKRKANGRKRAIITETSEEEGDDDEEEGLPPVLVKKEIRDSNDDLVKVSLYKPTFQNTVKNAIVIDETDEET